MPTLAPSTVSQLTGGPERCNHARAVARRTTQPPSAARAAMLQERARIARELHDSVAQTLYAITLAASRARHLLRQDEGNAVHQIIDDVLRLATDGQSELRMLLANMRSDPVGAGGLAAGLANLARDVRARSGLDVRLSLAGEPDMPAMTKEALVLITREALQNVIKHANARRVDIVLEGTAGDVVLLITDDGRGFDPALSRQGHFGLWVMRERVAAVGGTLAVVSGNGVGTQIRVSLCREARRSVGVTERLRVDG